MKIPFDIIYKKVVSGRQELYWEHELFAYKKILSATISHHLKPTSQITRSSALDLKYVHYTSLTS